MRRIGQWLPRAFFESFLIVLSILAALAVNQWSDKRARTQRASEALSAFVNEIRSNRDLLLTDFFLPHHKRLQQEYRALGEQGANEGGSIFDTGMHPAVLRDASWRSFSTGPTLVDFAPADVLLLSDIYRGQEFLERLNYGFMESIQAPRSDRETPEFKRDMIRSIGMFMNDVVASEERLLKVYERALDQMRAEPAK